MSNNRTIEDAAALLADCHRRGDNRAAVLHWDVDTPYVDATLETLRRVLDELIGYFEVASPFPPVRAILAPDRPTFDALVATVLGVPIESPSDPRRIAQAQTTDIALLAPSAYAAHSAYTYVAEDYRRMIAHELVHVVQEHLCPNIETSTLWWDEGLAVYLSQQWRFCGQFGFREPVDEGIRQRQIPDLAEVKCNPSFAYSYGWTLVRFLEMCHGNRGIAHAVRETADGDVFDTLHVDRKAFGPMWHTWLLGGQAITLG